MDQLLVKDMQQHQIDSAKQINSNKRLKKETPIKRHQTNTIWRATKKPMKLNKDISNNKWKAKTKESMKKRRSCFHLKIIKTVINKMKERDSIILNNILLKLIEP